MEDCMYRMLARIPLYWLWGLVILPFMGLGGLAGVNAQETSYKQELLRAEDYYLNGDFAQAIDILNDCLSKPDISLDEKKQAYRLLGLTYVAKDLEQEAKRVIRDLLRMVPNYKANPEQDPPPYPEWVEEVKKQVEREKREKTDSLVSVQPSSQSFFSKNKWYLVAGGAVVTTAVVAILVSGGEEEAKKPANLPGPPDLPGNGR